MNILIVLAAQLMVSLALASANSVESINAIRWDYNVSELKLLKFFLRLYVYILMIPV